MVKKTQQEDKKEASKQKKPISKESAKPSKAAPATPEKKKFVVKGDGKKVPANKPAQADKSKKNSQPAKQDKKAPKPAAKKSNAENHDEDEMADHDKLPGQKFVQPDEGDGLLIFYQSLYE